MIKINLVPTTIQKKREVNFEVKLLVGTLIFTFLLIGSVYLKNMKDIGRLENETRLARQQIAAMQPIYRQFMTLERDKKEMSKRIGVINRIREGRAVVPRIFYDLSAIMKENVWLKKVVKDEEHIELEGRSLDNESICEFVERLSKLPYFRGIELKSVEDVKEGEQAVKRFVVNGGVAS